ncbi:unnamed protein product [Diatraea saccharalis]|uniref:Uncharacterized protein n=1 Tax=Diatraea saccharalis TaxID=40085 RepID=A0A9N9WF86_9NEOP|nr:unnamed protein product [Diatraea saccharalis]
MVRVTIISFAVVAFVVCVLKKINSESVFIGERIENDRLIHKSVHEKAPFIYRSYDVAFPKYYEESDNVISAIYVVDNNYNDGASAAVDFGGVGHTFVNIHLRSALWCGFNFTIEIFGVKLK